MKMPCIIGKLILQGRTIPSTRCQKINAHHYHHIWVVGDIHGEYQSLRSRLHQLSFSPEADLFVSVGGDIDRGPRSLDVLCLLNQPWFISAKGNHEAMTLDAFVTDDGNMWLASGGNWFFDLNDSEQQGAIDLSLKFHHLPRIIKITNDIIKYVIAHTDYPGSEYLFGKEVAESKLLRPVNHVQKSLNSRL